MKIKKDLLLNKTIENSNLFRRIIWHLSKPTVFKPAIFMIIFFVLQQFTGIYTFQFHAVKMLQVLHFSIFYMAYWYVILIFSFISNVYRKSRMELITKLPLYYLVS